MNANVVSAIFRRNLVSYFSNPTGYVFICVFVLLSSFCAFWPYEFFNANLANLDQLNKSFPFVMLVFIPAITMSIWADERRQGTDELLLTIPASDFSVVLGKYLAAVAIYSVALLFSMVSNLAVLRILGSPDVGLFFSTYLGYWLIGLAMLAIGMVASFLTSNLTIAFILGALFNAPLAFAVEADAIASERWSGWVKHWSLGGQFMDFGRGVVSLSGILYFLAIVAVMFYLSVVLIGRRHWLGGKDGDSLLGHYVVRTLALVGIAVGGLALISQVSALSLLRADVTQERLSALSPSTVGLLRSLNNDRPVRIDAYISQSVPEEYVQTRANLLSTLEEMQALGGSKIRLQIHNVTPDSDVASDAEKRYGIRGREVDFMQRGAMSREAIFLGVVVSSGLDKIKIPFLDRGTPIEYELVRAICTATQQQRKKIGIVQTDAALFQMLPPGGAGEPMKHPLLVELERQYDLVKVDLSQPVPEDINALLAVQPSTLGPEQMDHFVAAVRGGVPTAIFEDPAPIMSADQNGRQLLGTSQPRQPQMMGGQFAPPMPKGDINKLWNLLGVVFYDREVVWQEYFPYPKIERRFGDNRFLFTFLRSDMPDAVPFNPQEKVANGQEELVFPTPGAMLPKDGAALKFVPLITSGKTSGTFLVSQIYRRGFNAADRFRDEVDKPADQAFNPFDPSSMGGKPEKKLGRRGTAFTIASHISGKLGAAEEPAKTEESKAGEAAAAKPAAKEINVILVGDVDFIAPEIFMLRDNPGQDGDLKWRFNNVPFVLNVLDLLAGDDRFIDIRNRIPRHRVLETIEDRTREAKIRADQEEQKAVAAFDQAVKDEQEKIDSRVAELKKREGISHGTQEQEAVMAAVEGAQRLAVKKEELQRDYNNQRRDIERAKLKDVRQVQDQYKLWSVLLPPIFPLLVAGIVYFQRRSREREGVSRQRLRN